MVSRHCKSATVTNPVPECDFFWLGKLLKSGVMIIGTIYALVGAGFANYGVVLEKHSTASKARYAEVVVSARYDDSACFVIERVFMWIFILGAGVASTNVTASSVIYSGYRMFLITSHFLVSWCSRDPFNGSLEVEVGSRRVTKLSMECQRDPD